MTTPVAPPQHVDPAAHPTSPTPNRPPRPDRGPLVQRLLLGAGALCVLVAAVVYLAVSWHRIGTLGQSGFALAVTALAALAAHLLVRHGLRASAETFAIVAAGLLALDLAGAHHLDVLGAGRLEWWAWLSVACGVVLVVTTGLALTDRLRAYRAVAVLTLAALPFTTLAAVDSTGADVSAGILTAVAIVVASALATLAAVIARHDAVTATAGGVAATFWWLIAAAAGIVAACSTRLLTEVVPAAVVWTALAAVLLVATGRVIAAGRTGDDRRILASILAPIAAAPGPLVAALAAERLGLVAMIAVAGVVAVLWAVPWTSRSRGLPLGIGAFLVVAGLPLVVLARSDGTEVAGGLMLLAGVAAAGGVLHGRGATRVVATVAAAAAAFAGIGLLAVQREQPALWLAAGWTLLALALTAAGTFVRTGRQLLVGAAGLIGGLAVLAGGVGQAVDPRSAGLAVALLGLGGAAVLYGAARMSQTGILLGTSAVALAALDLAAVARIDALEAYTLPIAAAALVAGVVGRIGRPELSSWAWTAPAVLVAAVPSTVAVLTDPGLSRLIVTAALAAAATVAGMRFRLAAPLLLGAATEAALAVTQLAPYAVGAPRWVTLALAGAVLLALGVLFERARRGAAAAGRWYATLQ